MFYEILAFPIGCLEAEVYIETTVLSRIISWYKVKNNRKSLFYKTGQRFLDFVTESTFLEFLIKLSQLNGYNNNTNKKVCNDQRNVFIAKSLKRVWTTRKLEIRDKKLPLLFERIRDF